ncbi:DUF3857 and transglutaminase domain-containing protein [candidate division WOR-3 bacterium]|nr:DUF3857 and transglutaminase domain-containing protein [candidate division WOR-3 bacterium]
MTRIQGVEDSRIPVTGWAVILSFVLVSLSFGGEIDSIIRAAPGHEAYPEAGALILLDRKTQIVDKNNSTTLDRYLVVKIFEDRGRDELGEITQRFNKDGQTVEVLQACTHRPDGSIAKPEARAISEVSAPEVGSAMAYTNAMLKVVSFPALEPGAIIEYHVRVKPKKSKREDGFSGVVTFGGFDPALKREFTLVVPKGVEFRYDLSQPGVAPVVESLKSQVSYTWTASNTPQMFREPAMPDIERLVPVLSYSSYRDWKQVATKLRKEFDKGRVASPLVKKLSDSLAVGKSEADAARAIYLFVTQKVRNVWLDYGDAGYETHKTPDILNWKYGDCRDKNRLLICLLAAQGITATPMVLNTTVDVTASVPSPDAFDWLVTMATVDGTPMLFDPFAEYRMYGSIPDDDAGVDALVLDSTNTQLTRSPQSSGDWAATTAVLALEMNGNVSGTVNTSTRGCYDNSLREAWRDRTPTDRKRALAQTASSIKTGAQIDTFWFSDLGDLTKPAASGFFFTAPRYAVTQKGELSLQVPTPAVIGEALFWLTSSARRTNPVETRPARRWDYTCNIKLPRGVKVDILPESVAVYGAGVSGLGGWTRTADGVSFHYSVRLTKTDYSVGEFTGLKAAADALSRPQLREVYFLK